MKKNNVFKIVGLVISYVICGVLAKILNICVSAIENKKTTDLVVEVVGSFNEHIVDYSIAMLGVYVAILVLFATSSNPAAGMICNKGLNKRLERIISLSMIFAISNIVVNLFDVCDMTYQIFCFEVGLVSLVCSLIFMRLTILIFRYNIEAFAKQEKEDEKRMEDIHTILLDIYKKNNHL